jgi:hypothetical protein
MDLPFSAVTEIYFLALDALSILNVDKTELLLNEYIA